ncbi:hypothetical protein H6B14_13320 [Phocaeicola coprophilus]|nr:hypothetical protein [Phocaeicola coprophilus]
MQAVGACLGGCKGILVVMIRGTKPEDVIKELEKISVSRSKTVKE